jgi:hypothetical protein
MNGLQMGLRTPLGLMNQNQLSRQTHVGGSGQAVRFGQSDPVQPDIAQPKDPLPAPSQDQATPEAPQTDWLALANQLITAAGEAPPAPQVPMFTPAEAKQLIAEGKIQQFNERLEYWRKYQAKPDEYFDMKGFQFGVALKNVEALQAIDSEVNSSETLDLRGCDLRTADFRGLKTLQAAFTQDETDPDSMEKYIKSALLDSSTQFSAATIKICT